MSTFLHRIMAILNLERMNLERTVKVDELYASIEANRTGRDDVVCLERRGDEYDWCIVPTDRATDPEHRDQPAPDTWMSFLATWPPDKERLRAFFDDLLAELESPLALIDVARRWTSPGRTCIEALAVYYYPGTWAGNLASPIRPQASSLVMSVPARLGRTQQARL